MPTIANHGSTPCESPEVAAIVETLRGKGTRTYLPLNPYVSEGWSTIKGEFTVSAPGVDRCTEINPLGICYGRYFTKGNQKSTRHYSLFFDGRWITTYPMAIARLLTNHVDTAWHRDNALLCPVAKPQGIIAANWVSWAHIPSAYPDKPRFCTGAETV